MEKDVEADMPVGTDNPIESTLSGAELGRALAARRQQGRGACVVCGQPIVGVMRHGRLYRFYCSERCRKSAYRARKRRQ